MSREHTVDSNVALMTGSSIGRTVARRIVERTCDMAYPHLSRRSALKG
jgi:hypothetical protein